MPRKRIQVKPIEKGWALKRSDSKSASGIYRTKSEATKAARQIAREQNLDLVIYEKVGHLASTHHRGIDARIAKDSPRVMVAGSAGTAPTRSKQQKTESRASELSAAEKANAWREWAGSHSRKTSFLSDEAISRESIYGDRG